MFNQEHNRHNTRSVKWDAKKSIFGTEDVLPMWVADMDFPAPDAVNDALIKRAKHGIYGYTIIDADIKQAIIDWQFKQHKWQINQKWISFSPSIVTSLHIAISALTKPDDKILIQTPVYTPFYDAIEAHNREIVRNPLTFKNNHYEIDFDHLEATFKTGVKAFIFCSPHNPVGRVWTKTELKKIADLCTTYKVLVFSDEVHSDLIFSGNSHIPLAMTSDELATHMVTLNAPSKTFNLAGLQASYLIIENEVLRTQVNQKFQQQGLNTLNTMGNIALEAAYNNGKQWLISLLKVLNYNKQYVINRFRNETNLDVIDSEGTYLLWINCETLGLEAKALQQFFIHKAKVGLNPGISYGTEGKTFMRMNIACPYTILQEGVNRIIEAVNNHLSK